MDSQEFETYVPVYDDIPASWEEARTFLVEQLRKLANGVNIREIGWVFFNEELSGKQFLPPTGVSGTSEQNRTILRKVINCSPLVIGANSFAHGITFDSSFTLIQLFGAATDSTGLKAVPLPNNNDSLTIDATNININVSKAYDRAYAIVEYIQEL